jgi:hypothetical protein
MQIEKLNREIFELPAAHPAYRFLRAFMECRSDCVGLEATEDGIDQEWFSESAQEAWSYSRFAYEFLSFDIVLDGWLTHAAGRTSTEQHWLDQLPRWRNLLHECRSAAVNGHNQSIVPIIEKVCRTLELWEECILARDTADIDDYPHRVDRTLYPVQPRHRSDQ